MPGHIIVNPVLVVGAVSNDRGERLVDLVEQRAEFGGIVDFFAGQGRGNVIKLEGIKVFIERCRKADKVVLS
jgi:hypothetical protein